MAKFDPTAAAAKAKNRRVKRAEEAGGDLVVEVIDAVEKAKKGDTDDLVKIAKAISGNAKPKATKADDSASRKPGKSSDSAPRKPGKSRTRPTTATPPKKGAPKKSGLTAALRARRGK